MAGSAPPGRRGRLRPAAAPEAECVAAAHELVALTLPELARVGVLAILSEGRPEASHECATALSRNVGGVLRLLDRAVAAHGRDNGYPRRRLAGRMSHSM